MFIGHFAVGFAAKKVSPKTSLGTLIAAACFLDLLWPVFVLVGLESFHIAPGDTVMTPLAFDHYPWSHSLLMAALWGLLYGGFVFWWGSGRLGGAVAGAAVVSHWLLDYVTHRPDLPLAPGLAERVGLGLWNHPRIEKPIEATMYVFGVGLYMSATEARDGVGRWGLTLLVLALAALHVANLIGPPPPNTQVVAYADLIAVLFLVWAVWVDRHRGPRTAHQTVTA